MSESSSQKAKVLIASTTDVTIDITQCYHAVWQALVRAAPNVVWVIGGGDLQLDTVVQQAATIDLLSAENKRLRQYLELIAAKGRPAGFGTPSVKSSYGLAQDALNGKPFDVSAYTRPLEPFFRDFDTSLDEIIDDMKRLADNKDGK